jgi:DNA invertase Pin-like site-specific DNA recombinase
VRHDGATRRVCRVSTDQQDLTAQRDGLAALGVAVNRIDVDQGPTGTNRERPGLREALAACREGEPLVVTKLDRLARSLPDARAIADDLTRRQVRLNLGGSVYDLTDPVGRLMFNVLAMVAESDLIRLRTKEGMRVAEAKGRLRGKPVQPALEQRWEDALAAFDVRTGIGVTWMTPRSPAMRALQPKVPTRSSAVSQSTGQQQPLNSCVVSHRIQGRR